MSNLVSNFRKTFEKNRTGSIAVVIILLVLIVVLTPVFGTTIVPEILYMVGGYEAVYSNFNPILSLAFAVIGVVFISRLLPFLKWFWFPDQEETPSINKTRTASKNMSGSNLKDEITGAFKAYNSSKNLPVDEDGFAIPRPLPKGAKIDKAYEDTMTLSIPAVRKWWFWLPFATVATLLFFVAIPLGGYFGYVGPTWSGSRMVDAWFNPLPLIVFIAATAFIGWWVWKWVYPRLTFIIQKESITVNGVKYRPELSDGLRIGYKMEGTAEAALESGLISKEAGGSGFKTLRYTYGAWGEDLPFAVNGYHAEEYVIWINNMIKQFNAPAPKENAPEVGRKKAEF